MTGILTITINPALDVSTAVEKMVPQQKLRCSHARFEPGGGGINVSRAIKELGGASHAFVALGGAMGQHMQRLLDDAAIEYTVWDVAGETRISFHVTETASGEQYRFVLPGPEFAAGDGGRLLDALADCVRTHGFDLVVASGSLPPGLPDDFFARLAERMRAMATKLILDTSGPPLAQALSARPFAIKADQSEIANLLDTPGSGDMSPRELADALHEREAADVVIITRGAEGAVVAGPGETWRIRPPKVEVRSAVGAGDSFVGAFTLALANGRSLRDAGRYGVAAAASAVTTEATELCRRDQTEDFFGQICEKERACS